MFLARYPNKFWYKNVGNGSAMLEAKRKAKTDKYGYNKEKHKLVGVSKEDAEVGALL